MAAFLIIEGLTGSLLAFNDDLTRLLNPTLFATPPSKDVQRLDLAAIAEHAEALIRPRARVAYFNLNTPDQVIVRCLPSKDPATGKSYDIGFKYLVLDPWTGKELGRVQDRHSTQGFIHNIMPVVYLLHEALALGDTGALVLCIVALVWTLDCFTGFYLTLPGAIERFLHRWKTAWLIKRHAGFLRLNFDLHRASGLWLWPVLFVFAWSSVMLEPFPLYDWVTGSLFDYQSPEDWFLSVPQHAEDQPPKLNWHAAQAIGERLMEEQAAQRGFKIEKPFGLAYLYDFGVYSYDARTNRKFPEYNIVNITFDGDTGALHNVNWPTGEHSGNTVSSWLRSLHMIQDPVDLLAYRIFVCVLGLVITLLSVTGVYIWWKKLQARKFSKAHRGETSIVTEEAPAG